jgi:glycosyltransferase involved in cell wall biosynthesis
LWALTFFRRWSCRFVAANISPSLWLERMLQLPRTSIISHGVTERPASPFPCQNGAKFAFIGRLVSTKGVELLLYAARELMNKDLQFRLLIIGEGPERKRLERLCDELGLAQRVDFVGQTTEEDVEALLSDAIAVVIPSLAGEVFGLVAAENMMRGRAVITPDGGPLAEIAAGTGLKFAAGDANSLAACMEKILHSPEIAMELGGRARRHARNNFRAEAMRDAHLALYQEVLK